MIKVVKCFSTVCSEVCLFTVLWKSVAKKMFKIWCESDILSEEKLREVHDRIETVEAPSDLGRRIMEDLPRVRGRTGYYITLCMPFKAF